MDDDLATPCPCVSNESPSSLSSPVKYLKSLGNNARKGVCAACQSAPLTALVAKGKYHG